MVNTGAAAVVIDQERLERELRVIHGEIKDVVLQAMRRRATGRKIVVEIPLDENGYPLSEPSKIQPPWHVVGRRSKA